MAVTTKPERERRQDQIDAGIKIGVLENNVTILSQICVKMDSTIDKIKDVANDTNKIMAAHEERFSSQEQVMEDHKKEDGDKFEILFTKFDHLSKSVTGLYKYLWMGMGGGFAILWILEFFFKK